MNKSKIKDAICAALKEIEQNEGKEGYWKEYDKATRIVTTLDSAGFKIVRKPKDKTQ